MGRGTAGGRALQLVNISERFNRTSSHEVLDPNLFATLEEVRSETAAWLRHNNTQRPHNSLGRVPPLPFRGGRLAPSLTAVPVHSSCV